jgi:hypothetical protein
MQWLLQFGNQIIVMWAEVGIREGVLMFPTPMSENIVNSEICGLLGNYTASCGNYLPTFRDNVSVPSSRVKIRSSKKRMLTPPPFFPPTPNLDL